MRTITFIMILSVVSMVGAVSWGQVETSASRQAVVEGNNEFAFLMYDALRAQKGNVVFSPYSISTAFAMAYAGARGQTREQMGEALHFPAIAGDVEQAQFHAAFGQIISDMNLRGGKGDYELASANALWGQKGYRILEEYLKVAETNYGGGLNEVDFVGDTEAARQGINKWVEEKTREKIKELIGLGVLNASTRLVLTNAVYFKGKWASQFKKERTEDGPFNLPGGGQIAVPMMNQKEDFGYAELEDLQILEMPYVANELSMIILLPQKIEGINDLEKKLNCQNLLKWFGQMHKREVIVSIPKFKMTEEFSLADTLKSLGMTDAFSVQMADFSGITGGKELFISAVVHKAFVDVNEEGTEAAAATGIGMAMTAVPQKPLVFKADRAFIFLIRDNKSGGILFIGRVANPKA